MAVQTVANDLQSNFITANQAGNGPDIVMGAHDWIGNMVQNGSIDPVSLTDTAKANYFDVALAAVTYDGQTYAAPYAVETVALFANKSLTSVSAPTTIEEPNRRLGFRIAAVGMHDLSANPAFDDRSEERRVGKECRSRWSPYH